MTIESTAIGARQLISEVSARNIDAFGDLCDRYRDWPTAWRDRFIATTAGPRTLQDAFAAVWRNAGRYRPRRGTVGA